MYIWDGKARYAERSFHGVIHINMAVQDVDDGVAQSDLKVLEVVQSIEEIALAKNWSVLELLFAS